MNKNMSDQNYHRYLKLPFTMEKPNCFKTFNASEMMLGNEWILLTPHNAPVNSDNHIWIEHDKPNFFTERNNDTPSFYYSKEKIDDTIIKWIESFNLKILNFVDGLHTSPNGAKIDIHSDTKIIDNATKINFTWGPDNSVTRWWKVKDESFLILNRSNNVEKTRGTDSDIDLSYALFAKEENCQLVYEKVINKPSLMNIGQLHSTYNPHPEQDRWTLCFTLLKLDDTHLQFEEALKIFKDFVYE